MCISFITENGFNVLVRSSLWLIVYLNNVFLSVFIKAFNIIIYPINYFDHFSKNGSLIMSYCNLSSKKSLTAFLIVKKNH